MVRNNLNLVVTQGQAVEGVVTVGIGLGGDLCAGGILHRVSICVEETNRHTLERFIGICIVRPRGILVVVDGSRNGAAHSEGSTRGVVVLVRINLVIIAQGCRVCEGLTFGALLDLHEHVEGFHSANVEVDVELARLHSHPLGVKNMVARVGCNRSIDTGNISAGLADTRFGGDEFHAGGKHVCDVHTRGNSRTVVLQADLVEHVVARHDGIRRLDGLRDTVGIAGNFGAVHLDAGNRLVDLNVSGDVDADLGCFVRLQVGDLTVFGNAASHCNGVPSNQVRVDRRGHGSHELDLFADLNIAVHDQAEALNGLQVCRCCSPSVGCTSRRAIVHCATDAHHFTAAGILNRRVLDRDIGGGDFAGLRVLT